MEANCDAQLRKRALAEDKAAFASLRGSSERGRATARGREENNDNPSSEEEEGAGNSEQHLGIPLFFASCSSLAIHKWFFDSARAAHLLFRRRSESFYGWLAAGPGWLRSARATNLRHLLAFNASK